MEALWDEVAEQLASVPTISGQRYVDRHRKRSKILVRERIESLVDPTTSFIELSPLAGWGTDDAVGVGVAMGIGVVEGVQCAINGSDMTYKGGSVNPTTHAKLERLFEIVDEETLAAPHRDAQQHQRPARPGRRRTRCAADHQVGRCPPQLDDAGARPNRTRRRAGPRPSRCGLTRQAIEVDGCCQVIEVRLGGDTVHALGPFGAATPTILPRSSILAPRRSGSGRCRPCPAPCWRCRSKRANRSATATCSSPSTPETDHFCCLARFTWCRQRKGGPVPP